MSDKSDSVVVSVHRLGMEVFDFDVCAHCCSLFVVKLLRASVAPQQSLRPKVSGAIRRLTAGVAGNVYKCSVVEKPGL